MSVIMALTILAGILHVHAQEQSENQRNLQKREPTYSQARDGEASLSGFRDIVPIKEFGRQEQQEDTIVNPKRPHSPVDEVEFGGRPEIDPEEVR